MPPRHQDTLFCQKSPQASAQEFICENSFNFLETDLLPKAGNVVIQSVLYDNGKEFATHWPNAQHKFKQACARNGITERRNLSIIV